MNYYKRHLGDYAKKTRTLTTYEHGVYNLLLDLYYAEEQPLDLEDAMSVCRAISKADRASVAKVLERYFEERDGRWHNSRADEELVSYRAVSETNRRIAEAREAKKRDTKEPRNEHEACLERDESVNQAISHKPITKEKKKRASAQTPLPSEFGVSPRVSAWAADKGHGRLAERLEHFVSYAKRSGKTYADWDEAFMTAIREDWAKLGNVVPLRPSHHDEYGRPRVAL